MGARAIHNYYYYYGWRQERSIMLWILWIIHNLQLLWMRAGAILQLLWMGARAIHNYYHYYGWRQERSIMLWILWIIHNLQLLWMRAGASHNSTIIMDGSKSDP